MGYIFMFISYDVLFEGWVGLAFAFALGLIWLLIDALSSCLVVSVSRKVLV